MGSAAASRILTHDQTPHRFAEWVYATLQEPWPVVLALNIVTFLIGGRWISRRSSSH